MRRVLLVVAALAGCGHFADIPPIGAEGDASEGDASAVDAGLPDDRPPPPDVELEVAVEIPDTSVACGETGKICDDKDPCTQNACDPETEQCSFPIYQDNDGDGFQPIGIAAGCSKALDCDDVNDKAFPGQTQFFPFASDLAEWDYNCDRVSEKRWTAVVDCASKSTACSSAEGWLDAVPECGVSGKWVTGCSLSGSDCVPSVGVLRTQECR